MLVYPNSSRQELPARWHRVVLEMQKRGGKYFGLEDGGTVATAPIGK